MNSSDNYYSRPLGFHVTLWFVRHDLNTTIVFTIILDLNQIRKMNTIIIIVLTSCISPILYDWICYSLDIKITDQKPSSILKRHVNYEKYQLKKFVSRIDCSKLSTCTSFQQLESFLS